MSNILFINGWGGAITSTSIAGLRNDTVSKFGRKIYAPPPVNHRETGLILRYLEKWQDVQILVALSCGCSTINAIAQHAKKGERIPYAMYCSPSIWCGLGVVPAIVERATQVTSWAGDFFNPGSRMLLQRADGNTTTVIDKMQTSSAHGFTPGAAGVRERLWKEIERTLTP
jgi:hypothetical protein